MVFLLAQAGFNPANLANTMAAGECNNKIEDKEEVNVTN